MSDEASQRHAQLARTGRLGVGRRQVAWLEREQRMRCARGNKILHMSQDSR